MTKTRGETTKITKTAMMIALVFLATFLIKVPSLHGYTHLGDCMIFISVLTLGWKKGSLAGGLGAALADAAGGYIIWILPTFFIKALMAIVMGILLEKFFKKLSFGWLIAAGIGGLVQIAGYFLVKIPLFGIGYAVTGLISLFIQTLSGLILSSIIVTVLDKSHILKKIKEA